ncbi:MAG: hypothetical protein EP343_03410 [Deltaproteobacteria bacterium]|nr:MAG: hypothetical protein EP343_03410 [Deltaproteobacteria bacterium]
MQWFRLTVLVIVVVVFGFQEVKAQPRRKACFHLLKVKKLARKHNIELRNLQKLVRLYCPRSRKLRAQILHRKRRSPSFAIFDSDQCSDSYLKVTVGPRTNCYQLPNTPGEADAVWADGKCINIQDTSLRVACLKYNGLLEPPHRRFAIYDSSTCLSGYLKAIVGVDTDCGWLPAKGHDAEGIRVGNKCVDIPDTSQSHACFRYKGLAAPPRQRVWVYNMDTCGEKHVSATFSPSVTCAQLPATGKLAQALRIKKKCINIADTSLQKACFQYRDLGHRRSAQVRFYSSDSCARNELIGAVSAWTDCSKLPTQGLKVEAIKVGKQCIDIDDTNFKGACIKHQNSAGR